jgi:alkylation response protein AidB-like acyl-CoA dehydrogenase
MNFSLTEDQRMIQESARSFLAEEAGADRRRKVLGTPEGWDVELWKRLGGEMGWTGIMIPEEFGGAGLGAIELGLILEEMGRVLAVTPFFETAALAAPAILFAGSGAQKEALLGPIAAGDVSATFALRSSSRDFDLDHIGPVFEGGALSGEAHFAPFAHAVDLLIVAARTGSGVGLIALPTNTPGVSITRLASLDETRPYSKITFNAVQIAADAVLGAPGQAADALTRTLAMAAALLSAEQTGGADYSLEAVVEYSQQRVQFDRPIGSFQAVKHQFADMMLLVEAARSAAYYACAAQTSDEAAEAASVARIYCSDAFVRCASDAVQLHGGIGFTWEHHAHLYFKRARSSATLLGSPVQHRETIAQLIGLDS